jgi:hypothetical protein
LDKLQETDVLFTIGVLYIVLGDLGIRCCLRNTLAKGLVPFGEG